MERNVGKRTFAKISRQLLAEKKMTSGKLERDYGISRNIYWRIRNEDDYRPSFRTAVSLCLALQCGLDRTEEILKLAGYALNSEREEDRIYGKFLQEECGCAETVNLTLEAAGLKPLFK